LDAGFIQVNPLHAAVPGAPTDPSPYRPSSRRFPDPVHLRVEDIPEYAHVEDHDRLRTLLDRAAQLREAVLHKDALIDRDAVWHTKREALELVRRVPLGLGRRAAYRDFLAAQGRALEDPATWYALAEQHSPNMQRSSCGLRDPRSPGTDLELVRRVPLGPGRRAAYRDFLAAQGRALENHATWYALAEQHGPDMQRWPAALRDPRSPGTDRARRELTDRVDFHTWLAWLTDEQL